MPSSLSAMEEALMSRLASARDTIEGAAGSVSEFASNHPLSWGAAGAGILGGAAVLGAPPVALGLGAVPTLLPALMKYAPYLDDLAGGGGSIKGKLGLLYGNDQETIDKNTESLKNAGWSESQARTKAKEIAKQK